MKKLLLIDGSNLIFRAYFATEKIKIETLDGRPANAIKTLITMINKMIDEEKPTNVFIALDTKKPTFRHENYEEYKANRKETPENLKIQFQMARELYEAMGIVNYGVDGYEADDLIATYAKHAKDQGYEVKVVSGDKDLLQLVDENVIVQTPKLGFGKECNYDTEMFKEKYDISPAQFIEYKAFVGDKSDNIIGVEGIGDKTARKLLVQYENTKGIIEAAKSGEIKGKNGQRIIDSEELIYRNIELVKLIEDAPILTTIDEMEFETLYTDDFMNYLQDVGFSTLLSSFLKKASTTIKEKKAKVELDYEIIEKFDPQKHTSNRTYLYTQCLNVNYFETKRLGIGICSSKGNFYLADENVDNAFYEWMESDDKKIVYDAKRFQSLYNQGNLQNVIFDHYLAINLLDTGANKYPIEFNLAKYKGKGILPFEEVYKVKRDPKLPDLELLSYDIVSKAIALEKSFIFLANSIEENQLDEVLYDIEMPLSKLLSSMEIEGVYIDREKLELMKKGYEKDIADIEEKIKAITDINFSSPKQLSDYLFIEKELPTKGIKKMKQGFSTDIENLEKLMLVTEDEQIIKLIELILLYRKNIKIYTTYLSSIEKYIKDDGRIHPMYHQLVSETGRITTQDPSIQNIPIRSEEGQKIRELFSAPKGKKIIAIDYSQIELRIMAHYSKDVNLCQAFIDDKDIHSETAKKIFPDGSKERSKAKAINFGIIYGMSRYGLAKQVGITPAEAQKFIDIYFEKYPGIKTYINDSMEFANEHGYVKTLFNRRRTIKNLDHGTRQEMEHAQRVAINTPIQGTAADLIKLAMIKVYEYTIKNDIKIIMQIHDELVFEVIEQDASKHLEAIRSIMENVIKLDVPLKATGEIADNWLEAK